MSSAGDGFLFTSESVTEGHPDKVADQISDAIVDAALTEDAGSRVAVETLLTTGLVVLAGEITTNAVLDFAAIARQVICEIGYDTGDFGFDGNAVGVFGRLAMQPDRGARRLEGRHALGEQAGDYAGQNIAGPGGGERGRRVIGNRGAAIGAGDHGIGALQQHSSPDCAAARRVFSSFART